MSLASRLARNPCGARRAARLGVKRKSRGKRSPWGPLLIENRSLLFREFFFEKILRQDRPGAASGNLVDLQHPPFFVFFGTSMSAERSWAKYNASLAPHS